MLSPPEAHRTAPSRQPNGTSMAKGALGATACWAESPWLSASCFSGPRTSRPSGAGSPAGTGTRLPPRGPSQWRPPRGQRDSADSRPSLARSRSHSVSFQPLSNSYSPFRPSIEHPSPEPETVQDTDRTAGSPACSPGSAPPSVQARGSIQLRCPPGSLLRVRPPSAASKASLPRPHLPVGSRPGPGSQASFLLGPPFHWRASCFMLNYHFCAKYLQIFSLHVASLS